MAEHNILGTRGEEIAVSHLLSKSFTILERNWRCGRLEVDIIARSDNELVIAEVKTRMDDFLSPPAEAVNRKKQESLVRAANAYIGKTGLNLEVRFDIITVIFSRNGQHTLCHIENAFYPALRS
jgi:putative endonuclease